jgi:hypothetical protein
MTRHGTTPAHRRTPRRLGLGAIAVVLAGAGMVVAAAPAGAAERVDSAWLAATCPFEPGEPETVTGRYPEGYALQREQSSAVVHPVEFTASARAGSAGPTGDSGGACTGAATMTDRLTVAAGSSGLPAGTPVQVEMTLRYRATLEESWTGEHPDLFTTSVQYRVLATLHDWAECDQRCPQAAQFHREEYRATIGQAHRPDDDGSIDLRVSSIEEARTDRIAPPPWPWPTPEPLCESYSCDAAPLPEWTEAGTMTGTVTLYVGREYNFYGEASANVHSQNEDGRLGRAEVEQFDVDWRALPGSEGVSFTFDSGASIPTIGTDPPVLALPDDLSVDAGTPEGAAVPYVVSASDPDGGDAGVACEPASGSVFPVGTTTVACTATDDEGDEGTGSFAVTVRGAADQLGSLLSAVTGVGPGSSLADKVSSALASAEAGRTAEACSTLAALLSQVAAQTGKSLSPEVAAAITADATRIRAVLGC